ncbi:MAG: ImmA/IrrE family metallo-endopeptidase [Candidatus Neomicrothrix subdominans]
MTPTTSTTTTTVTNRTTVLKRLRALTPLREISFGEALRIAELQASTLVALLTAGSQELDIADLPRIRITYEDLAVSGSSHWNGRTWVITIARSDSLARQRFTLMHEFKHIIDHGNTTRLYLGDKRRTSEQQAELAADYFAGCALIPKRDLKRAWGNGIQRTVDLALVFGVSEPAIRVRLAQTGLSTEIDHIPTPRCARPVRTPRGHSQAFRPVHPRYPYPRRRYV